MKKQDLKSGMYVERENGDIRLVLLGTVDGDVICNTNMKACEYCPDLEKRLYNQYNLSHFNETMHDSVNGNIVKVYDQYGRIIWQKGTKRKELKKKIRALKKDIKELFKLINS